MNETILYLFGVIQSIAVPMILFVWQYKASKRNKQAEVRAKARKKESLLSLEMTFATATLANATALALKNGKPNGEVEEAIKTYEKAKTQYNRFINEQFQEHFFSE
jgi:hypothetical protein